MLIEKKSGRSATENRRLAVTLAGTAGILNVLALGAFGLFPSNMTGNATQLSAEVLEWDQRQMWQLLLLLLCFMGGAFTSRLLVSFGKKYHLRTIYAHILLGEGIILAVPAIGSLWLSLPVDKTLLVNMLGFLLGLHNSTSTQLSQGKVRTTHITGTLTDAGITLATLLLHRVLRYSAEARRHHQYLLSIFLTATGAFITGGIIGVLSFNLFSMQAFSLAGIVLVLVSGITIRRTLQQQRRIAGRISPVRVP